jgi:predicted ribosomally synthesized peptide with nif11-like leader
MSEEQLKAFLEVAQSDASLQEKLQAAERPEAVVVIAKEVGFDLSEADLLKHRQSISEKELSDEEVAGVSGGTHKQQGVQWGYRLG